MHTHSPTHSLFIHAVLTISCLTRHYIMNNIIYEYNHYMNIFIQTQEKIFAVVNDGRFTWLRNTCHCTRYSYGKKSRHRSLNIKKKYGFIFIIKTMRQRFAVISAICPLIMSCILHAGTKSVVVLLALSLALKKRLRWSSPLVEISTTEVLRTKSLKRRSFG